MAYLGKDYKFDREENFDAFLKGVGVPEEHIQKLKDFKPASRLLKNGDKYTYISTSPEGTKETTFESGVQFDDKIQGTIPIKSTFTVDGDTVTQVIDDDKGSAATFKREYNGDELKVTITSSKWDGVAYRYYKA